MTDRALVSAGMWDALAGAWDARGDWHAQVTSALTRRMVDLLEVGPGQTVFEFACGPTADGAVEVARRQPDCEVTATDISPAMLAAAERRGAGSPVRYRLLDVAAPDLPDAGVDRILARWVYMLLPDPRPPFAEARRVLAADGRLVLAVFDDPSANAFFMVPAQVLIERGHLRPPRPGEPSMFALADPARTTAMLEQAGFARVDHTPVDLSYTFRDLDDLWSGVAEFTGPVSLAIAQLPDSEAAEIRTEIVARAAAFSDGEGYSLPGRALVFCAAA